MQIRPAQTLFHLIFVSFLMPYFHLQDLISKVSSPWQFTSLLSCICTVQCRPAAKCFLLLILPLQAGFQPTPLGFICIIWILCCPQQLEQSIIAVHGCVHTPEAQYWIDGCLLLEDFMDTITCTSLYQLHFHLISAWPFHINLNVYLRKTASGTASTHTGQISDSYI